MGGTARFEMDGVRDEKEWFGATRLPYTNQDLRASGNVWLAISKGKNFAGLTTHTLHVFLEDIPIDKRAGVIFPDAGGILRIYIDNDRFTDLSSGFESTDRYYEFNIITGEKSGVYRGNNAANTDWKKLGSSFFELKLGGCKNDPKDQASNTMLRCSAELTLPLSLSVDIRPAPDLEPGFGFGVQPVQNQGGLPEDISLVDNPNLQTGEVRRRRRLQSVLLGRPQGFKLKMMSFNVRRFYSDSLKGDFKKVTPEKIGQFLDEQGADIIAIQEGWDSVQVKAILTKLNTLRKARKVKEMKIYGPVDFNRAFHLAVQETTGGIFTGETSGETHGGLWIFSPLESARQDGHVFTPGEACRGEDCFKGKGVQWVRLLLNPPTLTNTACRQTVTLGDRTFEIPAQCPLPPSGDHYIDIFNTHMQASGTTLCSDSALGALAANTVLTLGLALLGQGAGLSAAASILLNTAQLDWKEPDPRPTFRYGRWINNGDLILNQDHIGQECENNISVSFPKDSCTHNWVVSSLQNTAEDIAQTGGTQLLEIDSKSCSSNDKVNVLANGDMPYVHMVWDWGGLGLMTFYGAPSNTRWKNDWILFDNATIGRCTRSATPNLCLDTAITELPPGQQHAGAQP